MTYQEYTKQRQDEFNALPIFWAFSNEQFKKGMESLGLTVDDTDKIYKMQGGGFYRKSDSPLIKAWIDNDKLDELMADYEFAKDAIYYEMCNHEYGINWQADWDVMSCFGCVKYTDAPDDLNQYWDALQWSNVQRKAYLDARREYFRQAEENDWF